MQVGGGRDSSERHQAFLRCRARHAPTLERHFLTDEVRKRCEAQQRQLMVGRGSLYLLII